MAYDPIESYGIIGDMHTVALVGLTGSIDWLCLPRFDSPSVCARILDDQRGGYFSIRPEDDSATSKQFYWPETNVLVTRFFAAHGAAELTDFMPVGDAAGPVRQVIRRVTCVRGQMRLTMICHPAFDYARQRHDVALQPGGADLRSAAMRLELATTVPLQARQDGAATATFSLGEGESAVFVLRHVPAGQRALDGPISDDQAERAFRRTVDYWRSWIARCRYAGRWLEMVHRSALALKLLTYEPTGAIVAAPTCSLPEAIGGPRNWDYRYTWIRDAAFSLYALLRLGFTDEARAFIRFLSTYCTGGSADRPLQVMYGIDGRAQLDEQTLDHLDGYRASRPVRIGNDAYRQLQLDIYGELLDAVYLYNKWGEPISVDLWNSVRRFVDWVCDHWQLEDEGIWEVRDGPRHFVYSKLMCWVAVDRGLRLAEKRSLPADRGRWLAVRDDIFRDILQRGWSDRRQSFVQAYGSEALDAANLIMPLVFFMSPTDPRMLATLEATCRSPQRGGLLANSLVHRYNIEESGDGLSGHEGTFNICTFWLVEALTRAGRFDRQRLDEARLIFERMLGFANHLGLYAEQTGHHGEALGNFPQAFTHLAVISAAFNLDRALGGGA